MSASRTDHARGLTLTAIGGMALTADIPLIKLADGEAWSILLLRSGSTFIAAMLVWGLWRIFGRNAPPLVPGRAGLAVALLYGISSITFLTAIYTTSTANVVFILAFNTMFAALLSWIFLGERPRPATFVAMAAMILGVGIIVSDSLGSGNLFGDAMAALSAFLIASAITITRATGKDMGFTSLVSVAIPFCVAATMVAGFGPAAGGLNVTAPGWILLNGLLVMPLAFSSRAPADSPRAISSRWVSMIDVLLFVMR